MTPQITVAIISWMLEERLIKTLTQIPKNTELPLNLCLHVQGEEQISADLKQRIIDAADGFVEKDIYFTKGNLGIAGPRAKNLSRAAKTPFVFMSDNDMEYQYGTIDAEYKFMTDPANSTYGMIDVVHDKLIYHRTVKGTQVICTPLNFNTQHIVDVDMTGGTSLLIRQKVALTPNIIDTNYCVGSWDFDFSLNVRKAGWKVATLCDRSLVAYNNHEDRNKTSTYKESKVNKELVEYGRKLFEHKWGFSCVYFPNHQIQVIPKPSYETQIISRAIYDSVGVVANLGIITESRLKLMQRNFIDSLKHQSDKDFTLLLVVGAKGNVATEAIESLDWGHLNVKFIYTSGDLTDWRKSIVESKNWGKETDKGCPEDIIRNLEYPITPITARMDIDDWVAPGWIAHMKHMAATIKEPRFLINYQVFGQAPDGQIYKFYAPHVKSRTSPFIALVQKEPPLINIYEKLHPRMGDLFDSVYTIPPSYAFMVIHDGNRSNQVYQMDQFLYMKEQDDRIQPNHAPNQSSQSIQRPIHSRVNKLSWRDKIQMTTQPTDQDRFISKQSGANA
jgi:GT2 family glycosyltransferase